MSNNNVEYKPKKATLNSLSSRPPWDMTFLKLEAHDEIAVGDPDGVYLREIGYDKLQVIIIGPMAAPIEYGRALRDLYPVKSIVLINTVFLKPVDSIMKKLMMERGFASLEFQLED